MELIIALAVSLAITWGLTMYIKSSFKNLQTTGDADSSAEPKDTP